MRAGVGEEAGAATNCASATRSRAARLARWGRDGGTLVTEEDSWDGLLARLFRSRMRRTMQSGIDHGVQALRIEAERRTRQSAAA